MIADRHSKLFSYAASGTNPDSLYKCNSIEKACTNREKKPEIFFFQTPQVKKKKKRPSKYRVSQSKSLSPCNFVNAAEKKLLLSGGK